MTFRNRHVSLSSFVRIGIFFVLVLVALWSSYQLITTVPRLFGGSTFMISDIFTNKKTTLLFTLTDTTLQSGVKRTLTWDGTHITDAGIFSFVYACNEGLTLTIEHTDDTGDTQFRTLPCNTPYSLPSQTRTLVVIPFSPAKRFIDSALSITFIPKDGAHVRDVVHVVVLNDENDGTPSVFTKNAAIPVPVHTNTEPLYATTTTRSMQLVPEQQQNAPNTIDLSVEITQTSSTENKQGYALFRVHNGGTQESGAWTFSTTLTAQNEYAFSSKTQQSIPAGGYTDVGVTFAPPQSESTFTVVIDPENNAPESNEKNNTAHAVMQ